MTASGLSAPSLPTVLLIQPWIEDFYATDCRIQPIGLAYLAASLKRARPDWNVVIFDALAGLKKRPQPWPVEFGYLKQYYHDQQERSFALFRSYYRFGKSDDEIRLALGQHRPFLIGISALFSPYYRQSLAMARICRDLFGSVPIVMGGNHATLHPESLLGAAHEGKPLCDYVLKGEAEEGIVVLAEALYEAPGSGREAIGPPGSAIGATELSQAVARVRHALSGLPGLVKSEGGQLKETPAHSPELEALPWPDLALLDQADYTFQNKPLAFLITSRSCPHRCSFCSVHAVFGKTYRMRKVDDIFAELQLRVEQGYGHIDIEDDNFTVNKKEVKLLLRKIAAERWPLTFSAMNGLSYLALDGELLELMREVGFSHLNLALVSADELVRRMTERPHTLEKFLEVMSLANALQFQITVYFIIGLPGQTVQSAWETLSFLAGQRCLVGVSPFYFTPGSPIHLREKDAADVRLASAGADPLFAARLTALDLENSDWKRADLYVLFKLCRVINVLKGCLDRGDKGPQYERALAVLADPGLLDGGAIVSPAIQVLAEQKPFLVRGYLTDEVGQL